MQVSPRELAERLNSEQPPHLLDVREPGEHAFVALPNATLIPLGEIAWRADEIDAWKEEDVVVYCHHGIRSLQAISDLRALGFTRLFNLRGGIDAWTTQVDPALPRY